MSGNPHSPRLTQSRRLRDLAQWTSAADPLVLSAVLISELAVLLRVYSLRGEHVVPSGDGVDVDELVTRVGATELRAWWLSHYAALIPEHQDAARAALCACDVSDGGLNG